MTTSKEKKSFHREVELILIGLKLADNRALLFHASKLAERLDASTDTMGQLDAVKYLACVDITRRRLRIKWDGKLAAGLGTKFENYPIAFNSIMESMELNLEFPIKAACKNVGAFVITSKSTSVYEKFRARKLAKMPSVQRFHFRFGREYKAAAIILAAKQCPLLRNLTVPKLTAACVQEFAVSKKTIEAAKKDMVQFCGALVGRRLEQTYREVTPEAETDSDEADPFNVGRKTKRQRRKEDFEAFCQRNAPKRQKRTRIIADDSSSDEDAPLAARTRKAPQSEKKPQTQPPRSLFPMFKNKTKPTGAQPSEQPAGGGSNPAPGKPLDPRQKAAAAAMARMGKITGPS